MRISWMDKITNEEVFRRTGEKRSLWKKLVKRRSALTYYNMKES
jgi:hypothetical protein